MATAMKVHGTPKDTFSQSLQVLLDFPAFGRPRDLRVRCCTRFTMTHHLYTQHSHFKLGAHGDAVFQVVFRCLASVRCFKQIRGKLCASIMPCPGEQR